MATPGAIAVYTSGKGVPENVKARPWKGVYHHWDGYPQALGNHLIQRVKTARGNVSSVVRFLVEDAPWGWSSCFSARPEVATERSFMKTLVSLFNGDNKDESDERYSKDDPGLPVAPDDTGNVAYVYAFDIEDRRLDAFATHSDANGERIGSVRFSETGDPDLPAFDWLPVELVQEPRISGPTLTAEDLSSFLNCLPPLGNESLRLEWVNASETDAGELAVLFRILVFENGSLQHVVQDAWSVVPKDARNEPERVRSCLKALVSVVNDNPKLLDAFWIASLDPLRRSGARQPDTFRKLFTAYAELYLAAE